LEHPENPPSYEAGEALRGLIDAIVLTPNSTLASIARCESAIYPRLMPLTVYARAEEPSPGEAAAQSAPGSRLDAGRLSKKRVIGTANHDRLYRDRRPLAARLQRNPARPARAS